MSSLINKIVQSAQTLVGRVEAQYLALSSSTAQLAQAYAGTDPNKIFENGTFKSTTVALGSDPAVGSKPPLLPPTITSAQINTDGLNNPYTVINFSLATQTLQANNVIAFKVYRQQVAAEDLAQEVEAFVAADFDKFSQQSTPTGKFSADKKATYVVNAAKSPQVTQNTNLYIAQQTTAQQNYGTANGSNASSFPTNAVTNAGPQLIATINNQSYQASASLKQVYVQSQSSASISYSDYNVTYGSGYVYTVTSLCENSDESTKSESISMVVLNLAGISTPVTCQVKQTDALCAKLTVGIQPSDLVKYVYVFKRNTEDLVFHPFAKVANQNNFVSLQDLDVEYLNSYVYRVLLENVFGAVSEPAEVNLTCTGQHILGPSRSNNLKLPILLASQDQNSQGIKLTIFPNDQRILYYTLERRNLTAGETVFTTPSNKTQQFWPVNQFFVQPLSQSLLTSSSLQGILSNSLPASSQFISFADTIEFVDTIVAENNYYQYRTIGRDLYGNVTGYGFASLKAVGKNTLRSPVNFVAELLRETPYRTKLTWEDDNAASRAQINNQAQQTYLQLALSQLNLSQQAQSNIDSMVGDQDLSNVDLASVLQPYSIQQAQITTIQNQLQALANTQNPIKYQLQRRLSSDATYSSFPYTENAWVVDEVACSDAILFSTGLVSGASPQPVSSSATVSTASLSRSFGLPSFMQAQQVYQYRVAAMTLDGETSDFCDPITVVASAQISSPTSFSASILNPKVSPAVVRLQWGIDPLKTVPDHWRIERMVNSTTDTFRVIGNSYLSTIYFDRSAQTGQQYLYRLRSVSATGDESDTQTVSIST